MCDKTNTGNTQDANRRKFDNDPPLGATTEMLTRLLPTPHQVRVDDLPSLFAGKLHAVLPGELSR